MALEHAYQRIARRSLEAADAAINANIQEKGAFLAYHAFESAGCSLSLKTGLPVGQNIAHHRKVANFLEAAKRVRATRIVLETSLLVGGIRNSCLYPTADHQGKVVSTPERMITLTQAKNLRARVEKVISMVDSNI